MQQMQAPGLGGFGLGDPSKQKQEIQHISALRDSLGALMNKAT